MTAWPMSRSTGAIRNGPRFLFRRSTPGPVRNRRSGHSNSVAPVSSKPDAASRSTWRRAGYRLQLMGRAPSGRDSTSPCNRYWHERGRTSRVAASSRSALRHRVGRRCHPCPHPPAGCRRDDAVAGRACDGRRYAFAVAPPVGRQRSPLYGRRRWRPPRGRSGPSAIAVDPAWRSGQQGSASAGRKSGKTPRVGSTDDGVHQFDCQDRRTIAESLGA
jgi:hypothetical protein